MAAVEVPKVVAAVVVPRVGVAAEPGGVGVVVNHGNVARLHTLNGQHLETTGWRQTLGSVWRHIQMDLHQGMGTIHWVAADPRIGVAAYPDGPAPGNDS